MRVTNFYYYDLMRRAHVLDLKRMNFITAMYLGKFALTMCHLVNNSIVYLGPGDLFMLSRAFVKLFFLRWSLWVVGCRFNVFV